MANPFPFVSGTTLLASQLNGIGEWTSYTPVLTATTTNPTLGTGSSSVGSYARIQDLIFYRFVITFGTSGVNAGVGTYRISLPVAAAAITNFTENPLGTTMFTDSSLGGNYFGNAWFADVNNLSPVYQTGFNGTVNNIGAVNPVIPAANDVLSGFVTYRAA